MIRDHFEEWYKIKKLNVACVSVLYEDNVPIIYAINGDDRDVLSNCPKKVREEISDILGTQICEATINDTFSIFDYNGNSLAKVKANRDIYSIKSNYQHIKINEPIRIIYYTYVKFSSLTDYEKRFFTCAERKIIGRYNKHNCYYISYKNLEHFTSKKPCVLCEPTIPIVYYMDDYNNCVETQLVPINKHKPFLEYRLFNRKI